FPMIDHVWRERLPLGNRLIGVRQQAPFSIGRRLEALRSAAIAGAKSVRESMRQRSRYGMSRKTKTDFPAWSRIETMHEARFNKPGRTPSPCPNGVRLSLTPKQRIGA